MKFERQDKKQQYQSFERHALEQARKAADPQLRDSWLLAADSWRKLGEMVVEHCFCGRPAIGAKYYEGGGRAPYCGEHLQEALLHDLKTRIGLKSDN